MRWTFFSVLALGIYLAITISDSECLMFDKEEAGLCVKKIDNYCPDRHVNFVLYTSEMKGKKRMMKVHHKLPLKMYGWNPRKKNVMIIHGFNGTESKSPMSIIRNAYLLRGDYNVISVDWSRLAMFPCYLSALSNTKLVAQCSAQFYSHLTYNGAPIGKIHCVGHSLGAHICGMISRHLTHKIHRIIGLDPARPLVEDNASDDFRLTRDDAHIVQVIHTNAGLLGTTAPMGHVDFCVNGGTMQPSCLRQPQPLRQSRCSHFMSACFFAATVPEWGRRHRGLPCTTECQPLPGFKNVKGVSMGEHTPDDARGVFCLRMKDSHACPFD